jgi:DNA-binding response OmpR family regulator
VNGIGFELSRQSMLSIEKFGLHMSDEVETRTVDVHIRNLRKKIGAQRISTVVRFGYRYDPPQENDER